MTVAHLDLRRLRGIRCFYSIGVSSREIANRVGALCVFGEILTGTPPLSRSSLLARWHATVWGSNKFSAHSTATAVAECVECQAKEQKDGLLACYGRFTLPGGKTDTLQSAGMNLRGRGNMSGAQFLAITSNRRSLSIGSVRSGRSVVVSRLAQSVESEGHRRMLAQCARLGTLSRFHPPHDSRLLRYAMVCETTVP
ncbi:hypothetical protein Poly24_25520 [Rosistilla carotiformis]|uniref:Uncharacterized protein n=1 Tax=Rosistilla carotiformis TaxID=2528017 RepID=A0A518JTG7_9BACT|nr:hypothetical protein Poly24_25520 [Rosistilla carotiformis]